MVIRLVHVPTIVSLKQLQEDALAASGSFARISINGSQENIPLNTAASEGACLPLYQYVPPQQIHSLPASRASSMAAMDWSVPEFESSRGIANDAWDPSLYATENQEACKMSTAIAASPFSISDAATAAINAASNVRRATIDSPTQISPRQPPLLALEVSHCMTLETMSTSDTTGDLTDVQSSNGSSPRASLPPSPLNSKFSTFPVRQSQRSTIDTVVTSLWDDCAARGLFRYDVSQCDSKIVPGKWGWVAQLNEGRASKKRPTELRVDAVLQPFDNNKFNFGKAYLKEALFQFEPKVPRSTAGFAANEYGSRMVETSNVSTDPTMILINVSPIDYGHILLTPRVLSQQPQQIEPYGLSAALALVREVANPTFRLGYNSLGAYATINHLHFQGYYLPCQLPCERAATRDVPGYVHPTLRVATLTDYPVNGWVVEVKEGADRAAAELDMAGVVMDLAGYLQSIDQPFNILFVEQGHRAFVWPQCYAERQAAGAVSEDMLDTGVNPAVFEVAGHLVLKRAQDYEDATDDWAARLLAGVSLDNDRFDGLTAAVFQQANN